MKILSDSVIENFLLSLNKEDFEKFQNSLLSSLKEYAEDHRINPQRIVTKFEKDTSRLIMASIGNDVGIKAITGSPSGFKGATLLIDKTDGTPIALMNCGTLTPYRTALCSSIPFKRFKELVEKRDLKKRMLVFGAGQQAYWHVVVSLKLYPEAFNEIFICNRTLSKAHSTCESLSKIFPDVSFRTIDWNDSQKIKAIINGVSVIYGCLPSTDPKIRFDLLEERLQKKEIPLFISTIGSYKPHMTEVDNRTIEYLMKSGSKILVDAIDFVSEEAGEIIQNNVPKSELVEVSYFDNDLGFKKYMGEGNLLFCKIVGMSVMDINVASNMLKIADDRNYGVHVDI